MCVYAAIKGDAGTLLITYSDLALVIPSTLTLSLGEVT